MIAQKSMSQPGSTLNWEMQMDYCWHTDRTGCYHCGKTYGSCNVPHLENNYNRALSHEWLKSISNLSENLYVPQAPKGLAKGQFSI